MEEAPTDGKAMPSLDLSRVSYAAMGGAAPGEELEGIANTEEGYNSSSSEDLDGMATYVARLEAMQEQAREEAQALEAAREQNARLTPRLHRHRRHEKVALAIRGR